MPPLVRGGGKSEAFDEGVVLALTCTEVGYRLSFQENMGAQALRSLYIIIYYVIFQSPLPIRQFVLRRLSDKETGNFYRQIPTIYLSALRATPIRAHAPLYLSE